MSARGAATTLALAALVTTASVAFAATLGISSQRLTTVTKASTVPSSTCNLANASEDTWVNEGSQNQTNGNATALSVRSALSDRRTFVKFDLSSCAIPSTARVTSATLKLFLSIAPPSSRTHQVWRVTSAWSEATLDWNPQPSLAGAATASTATGTTAGVTLSWTVTNDVQTWAQGTANHGWRVNDQTEGSVTQQHAEYRSSEFATAAQRPKLDITYYP
jgi:hypothetical protein